LKLQVAVSTPDTSDVGLLEQTGARE
jgi:hypothetical protein